MYDLFFCHYFTYFYSTLEEGPRRDPGTGRFRIHDVCFRVRLWNRLPSFISRSHTFSPHKSGSRANQSFIRASQRARAQIVWFLDGGCHHPCREGDVLRLQPIYLSSSSSSSCLGEVTCQRRMTYRKQVNVEKGIRPMDHIDINASQAVYLGWCLPGDIYPTVQFTSPS